MTALLRATLAFQQQLATQPSTTYNDGRAVGRASGAEEAKAHAQGLSILHNHGIIVFGGLRARNSPSRKHRQGPQPWDSNTARGENIIYSVATNVAPTSKTVIWICTLLVSESVYHEIYYEN